MKKIEAIFKPFKIEDAKTALNELGAEFAIEVNLASGYGKQNAVTEIYRGQEYTTDRFPRSIIEVVVEDHEVQRVTKAIAKAVRTGRIGDGLIIVTHIDSVHDISSGDARISEKTPAMS